MKKLLCVLVAAIVCLGISAAAQTETPTPVNIGLRAGLGMDISGGFAYGIGGNYQFPVGADVVELGLNFYGNEHKEDSTSGIHTYKETTNLLVFGVLANYLINYSPSNPGLFFVGGVGLAAVSVDWTEESATDTSLGTPLPGGGSTQNAEAFAGGSVINLGIGYLLGNGLDMRIEIPTILVFGAPGKAATVVPTFTITGGYRF
jgi:hypothetical protein